MGKMIIVSGKISIRNPPKIACERSPPLPMPQVDSTCLALRAGHDHTGINATHFATVLPPYMRPVRWHLIDQPPRNAIGQTSTQQVAVF